MPPLSGLRVLVTRPARQGSKLAELLAAAGATPILIPAIGIAPPASWCALDAALTTLRTFDWLIFTSANAVNAFAARARTLGISPNPTKLAVIGPATAQAVRAALGREVDLMPEQFVAESLAAALSAEAGGASILLVRAAVARDLLPQALGRAGATVTIAEAYRNVIPDGSPAELQELFRAHPPHAITFTSASTAQNLSALLEAAGLRLPDGVVLASIGPVTSAAMRELGMEPTVEAAQATMVELVAALERAAERQ